MSSNYIFFVFLFSIVYKYMEYKLSGLQYNVWEYLQRPALIYDEVLWHAQTLATPVSH